jgi:hypothetical protein
MMIALALANRNLNNNIIDRNKYIQFKDDKNKKRIKSFNIFKKIKFIRNRFY